MASVLAIFQERFPQHIRNFTNQSLSKEERQMFSRLCKINSGSIVSPPKMQKHFNSNLQVIVEAENEETAEIIGEAQIGKNTFIRNIQEKF